MTWEKEEWKEESDVALPYYYIEKPRTRPPPPFRKSPGSG